MNKLLIIVGILLLAAIPIAAQDSVYMVQYFSNNAGPVADAPDQVIRLQNVGVFGTPLTSPTGDVCSNIFVFDNNQEMIACCACRLTPNELATASVGTQLTNNPLTSVVPVAGVVKIVNGSPPPGGCNPSAFTVNTFPADSIVGYATHLQVTGAATYVTETRIPEVGLPALNSGGELGFLATSCSFVRYLGSGKGTCSCTVPGN
jgi:hypothetical protein